MILYFSGTGNSRYVAEKIGRAINEEVFNLFEKIRKKDVSPMYSDTPWIVVAPTYAWRIPRLLQQWLEKTALEGNKEIRFVMTCGGSIGNAEKYLKKLSKIKGLNYRGCYPIVMPENYIALFSTPTKEQALEIIARAEKEIDLSAEFVKSGKAFPPLSPVWRDKLSSGIINDLFYPMFVRAKKFYATDRCISCGRCVKVCPLNNVLLENGRPIWGNECTHCMACICRCPTEAIEYGEHSKGLPRYTCPKQVSSADEKSRGKREGV